MIIFRSVAIYLALAGIGLAIALMRIMSAPLPEATHVSEPAVNPYIDAIAASGIVESTDRNIAVGVPQSGIIINLMVGVWDSVKQNQPLFQVDDRELQAQLIVQKANILVSEATLERLKDQLNRLEAVTDARAVSKDEVKTRQNDVSVSAAQLEAIKALAKQTESLIDRLIVRAPKDGVILQNNIRLGEYASTNSLTPAMLLGNIEHLQVRVDIDEQNASRLKFDQPAVAFPKNNTSLSIPLHFVKIEPYVLPKKSLTGGSEERVDTRVLQVLYSFEKPENFNIYVGQQVDVFIQDK